MKLTYLARVLSPLDNLQEKKGKDVDIIYQYVGATAGNVMMILAWYGWHMLIVTFSTTKRMLFN